MTWQTAAVRYVSIGEKSARFRDLLVPFTLNVEPVETVIWLPNGGGKSSLLSLKSAVVLPASGDFTGAGRENHEKRPRRLDDYVSSGDTSHTVIEWTADDTTTLFGQRQQMMTGAVYEWPERRRPGTDQDSRLNKMWWSAVPMPGVLELTSLPVRDGRLLTLTQFRDRLRQLNTEHPELQVQISSTQAAWEEQLGKLGIDTALYRYQARMNTSEGGIAKVFNFNTVRDFIDLVVDVIAGPEQAADCGKIISEHAKNLFRRPGLQTELAFLTEARTLLTDLAETHIRVETAAGQRQEALKQAARLRAALSHAATHSDTAAELATRRSIQLSDLVSDARRERGRLEGVRAEVQLQAATARQEEASAKVEEATDLERRARADQIAWAAAGPLAEAAGHDAGAEELRDQLRPERAERAALSARLDIVATAARQLLDALVSALEDQTTTARGLVRSGTDRLVVIDKELRSTRQEVIALEREGAAAKALIEEHERALVAARRTEALGSSETPAHAYQRHREAVTAAEKLAGDFAEAESRHRCLGSEAGSQVVEATGELVRLKNEFETAAVDEQRLRSRHRALAEDDRLIALAEADHKVDVWGDSARLRSALTDAARDADGQALTQAVEAAEDERLVSAVDSSGLLPAPVATTAVAGALTQAGIVAETAWAVLARDYPDAARQTAAAARADIVSGVVVQDADTRSRALILLASTPTLAHIPLVTADELAQAAAGQLPPATLPTVPLHDGLHAQEAAFTTVERLKSESSTRSQLRATYAARAQSDRVLLAGLSDFLAQYPGYDSLDRATQLTADSRTAVEGKLGELRGHKDERERQQGFEQQARQDALVANKDAADCLRDAESALRLEEAAGRLELHRRKISDVEVAVTVRTDRTLLLEEEVSKLTKEVTAADLTRQRTEGEVRLTRQRSSEIVLVDQDAPVDATEVKAMRARGLTEVLASHEMLRREWQNASSASVLEARLAGVQQQALDARERSERALVTYNGDIAKVRSLAEQRGSLHTVDSCEASCLVAAQILEAAVVALTQSRAVREASVSEFKEAKMNRERAQRVTEPVNFTTVEDADIAAGRLQGEIASLTTRETQLAKERDGSDADSIREKQKAENLRDLFEPLPSQVLIGADLAGVEMFGGEMPAARLAVTAAASRLKVVDTDLTAAREARTEMARRGLKLAGKPAYHALPLAVRDRLSDNDTAGLGAKAADYGAEVEVRLTQVLDLLAQIGQDENRVSQLVSTHVHQLLTGIAGTARASKLPPGLGELSGKQFINLRFVSPSDDELTSRVGQEILSLLDAAHGETKSLPSGVTVLRRCVHAAVGNKGFRAEVLKPNEHMLEQRVDVTEVALFSDGEKLTTCVLLFCAFARTRHRGRASAGVGAGATGTLLLDNPFGRASTAQLVALQLAVAKAQQVHLVYATGLEDMGALLQFRRIIRLRNRKPVGTTDGHVQFETAQTRGGEVTGVSVVRPDAPVPVELATSDGGTVPQATA